MADYFKKVGVINLIMWGAIIGKRASVSDLFELFQIVEGIYSLKKNGPFKLLYIIM